MAAKPARLTIACTLQGHDPATDRLRVNIALFATGNPLKPLTEGLPLPAAPPFAGTTLLLAPHVSSDLGALPTLADVPAGGPVFKLIPPAEQLPILKALAKRFRIEKPAAAPVRLASRTINKFLPRSYRTAFAFAEPKTKLAVTDDSYECARRCPPVNLPPPKPQDDRISWGDAYAMLLRQPKLARAAGLIHSIEIDASPFADGGFLFLAPAAGEAFAEQAALDPEFLRIYATRVPPLKNAPGRALFTPVLFPVAADAAAAAALGSFDDAFGEALRFDDGFARIVHCRQPDSMDNNAVDGAVNVPPATDVGLQIGWDDEDLVVTLNRQLSPHEPGKSDPAPAPPGFSGWCVDVRETGGADWHSLCGIESAGLSLGEPGAEIGPFRDELAVEVQPSRIGDRMWLQPYAAHWRARSLVAPSIVEEMLAGQHKPSAAPYVARDPDQVRLRYSRTYDVRVRMRDLTGGGPRPSDKPHHSGEAPVASWTMRRFVPPTQLDITPGPNDAAGHPTSYTVRRPRIRWPEAVYAGDDDALARLEALMAAALQPGSDVDVSLPDPDAEFLEVRVLVRQPRFDQHARDDGYIEFYTAYRSFPQIGADGVDAAVVLPIEWRDATHLGAAVAAPSSMAAPGAGPILLPTARDVKLELRAVTREDTGYFGNDRARFGPAATVIDGVIRTPKVEAAVLNAASGPDRIATVFMRPSAAIAPADRANASGDDPNAIVRRRFAAALDLIEANGAILGPPGRRTCFAAFGLAHSMAPDNASLRLAAVADLIEKWVSVIRISIERDWTWLGVDEPAFVIEREIVNRTTGIAIERRRRLGAASYPHAINRQAALGEQDRDRSELIVLDAFEPMLGDDGLPHELEVTYWVSAATLLGAQDPVAVSNALPIVTPPADLPKVVSAGHAFSPYEILGDYQETGDRRRMLWLEFDQPPADPRDGVFVRVLTSAPDPMLLASNQPIAEEPSYEAIVLDPEAARVVRPGQADDFAGLSAMQALIPAKPVGGARSRHYLVPLPPNLAPESPELLGFFTYDICFGHGRATPGAPFWSTAQGRYGTPVRLEGVRHPPPTLPCAVERWKSTGVRIASEHAVASHLGRKLPVSPPATELWVAAYARLRQADDATNRNIQIDLKKAEIDPAVRRFRGKLSAAAAWDRNEIRTILDRWRLPEETPLGFLVIELLPEPNGGFPDPMGGDLGQVRILRTSRLVDAGELCCH